MATDDSSALLISLVHEKRGLWDKSSDKYRHVGYTKAAWAEICRKLSDAYDSYSTVEQDTYCRDVIRKWSSLRDSFVKSLKKNRRYIYGDLFQFLAPFYEDKIGEDDGEDEEAEDESGNSYIPPVEINAECLIASVEKRPCLWNKLLPTYKDKLLVKKAWLEVTREVNKDFEQMDASHQEQYRRDTVKKWNNIRDTFAKSLKKTKSGRIRKYVYADQMKFLRRFYTSEESDLENEDWHSQLIGDELSIMPDSPDVILKVEDTVLSDCDGRLFHQSLENQADGSQKSGRTSSSNPNKRHRPEQNEDDVEYRIMSVLDRLEPDNRHISFFKGILPSLNDFDEDEVLEFQCRVLQAIREMRKQKYDDSTKRVTNNHNIKTEMFMSEDDNMLDNS